MGIPRKGSRRVTVDGKEYRYLVKETHIPEHRDQKELSVTVQEDGVRPGRVLQWRWPYGAAVLADDVKAAVRLALERGWVPSERGVAFVLGDSA